jgi:hypothetical protein
MSAAVGALALAATPVVARTLTLVAAQVANPEASMRELRVEIEERGADAVLRLQVAEFAAPRLGLAGRLAWNCTLRREAQEQRCAGPVTLADDDGERRAELELRLQGNALALGLRSGDAHLEIAVPFAAGEPYTASVEQMPATWLKAPLARSWRGGELREGVFDAAASVHGDGRIEATYAVTGLSFNSADGTVSGKGLSASGRVQAVPDGADTHWAMSADLRGGGLALGAVRIVLPDTPVAASLDAVMRGSGRWDVARFGWSDPQALIFEANGVLEPAALAPLQSLEVRLQQASFPLALQRYAQAPLAAQGYGKLALKGDLAGELAVDRDGVQRIALTTAGLDVDDGAGRAARAIRGGVDWARAGDRPPAALAWRSLRVGDWSMAAASSRWQSRAGALQLVGDLRTKLLGGELALTGTVLHPLASDGERVASRFALRGLGYDSADGSLGAAHVGAQGSVRISGTNASPRIELDARLLGGEALAGAVYVKLPQAPLEVRADAIWDGESLTLQAFDWNDAGTLQFSARGRIAPADAKPLRALQVDLRQAQIDRALDRYARSWLASKGYPELTGSGRLAGALSFDDDGLQRFGFDAQGVSVRDGGGRFAFEGIDGGLDWEYRGDTPASTLAWQSAELFKIPLGPASARLDSRRGAIVLAQPLEVAVLGGKLRLEKLSLLPRSPRGERYAGSFAIVGLDMPQISAAFGWPKFPGSLSGGIPEIVFAGDTIEFRGGLDLYVFDGHLGVSGLTLERPFGVAPSLGADIHFENFDLEQFTSAFSLGGMSGRLFGTIDGLRLVDWSPVALDAWLRTDGGGRLSYKAVNDITSLGGGGGLSNNLQTMALKVFDTFGYRRFGLRCRLTKEVCLMGGIDPLPSGEVAPESAADRYTMIEGSGVPRLDVVGHRRRVDWPTLVRRVRESMQGDGPIVK